MTGQPKAKADNSSKSLAKRRAAGSVQRAGTFILEPEKPPGPPDWVRFTAEALTHKDDDLRQAAALKISATERTGEAKPFAPFFVGPLVMNMIHDGSADIRRESVLALRAIGIPEIAPHTDSIVYRMKDDEDAGVRAEAATCLGTMGKHGVKHAELLCKLSMEDPDEECRKLAARAFGTLGAQHLGPHLEEMGKILVEDRDPIRRFRAASSFAELGEASIPQRKALQEAALNDQAYGIRQIASKALAAMGGRAGECVETFIHALEDSEEVKKRKNAAQALGVYLPAMNKSGVLSQADTHFQIILNRNDKKPIGVEIDGSDKKTLRITAIKPGGLVEQWNIINPEKTVEPGCRITRVNEFELDSDDLMAALKLSTVCHITVTKSVAVRKANNLAAVALNDKHDMVRTWSSLALGSLAEIARPHARKMTEESMHNKSDKVRQRNAASLELLGPVRDDPAKQLAGYITNDEEDVIMQCRAATTLGRLGSAAREQRELLMKTALNTKKDSRLRAACAKSLRSLKSAGPDE